MFFLIGGLQPKTVLIERQTNLCPSCGHFELCKKRVDHYFSLFFIPLFPVKKGKPFLVCNKCQKVVEEKDTTSRGTDKEHKKCQNCGKYSQTDFSFCPYCGKLL